MVVKIQGEVPLSLDDKVVDLKRTLKHKGTHITKKEIYRKMLADEKMNLVFNSVKKSLL